MGSDRARVSYDERRHYRGVVAQQGRVTLEADVNEAWTIEREQERETLIDVVGPTGTPDDGYAVGPAGGGDAFDLVVGAGTMYTGGVRTVLDGDTHYAAQTDWLDTADDPDWVDPGSAAPGGANELVYLELTEVEVSMTEDSRLQEVALGGPDTTQRLRVLQRVKRLGTDARTCAEAAADAAARFAARGQTLDTTTRLLESSALLQVGFDNDTTTDPSCDPDAAGGYLGAENQLIRVQVASWDAGAGSGTFVWGYDDASFLYRAAIQNGNPALLELARRPPDDVHQPRAKQAVEVLRAAAYLDSTDWIAAQSGDVQTLAAPYDPDTQTVTLPAALTGPYVDEAETPQLFLRVWEEVLAIDPGTPTSLGSTGIAVTLSTQGGAPFHVGDFWLIAVRPTTPTVVYPPRLLDEPQPPDGPRMWECPLAVVHFGEGGPTVLDDCRNPFDDLVDLTRRHGDGCCDVSVRPEDLKGDTTLQSIVDGLANRARATLCLKAGEFVLEQPLRLGPEHSNLTIQGCSGGTFLRAADDVDATAFGQGLIVLERANGVTLRDLRLRLPQVQLLALMKEGAFAAGDDRQLRTAFRRIREFTTSIGVRAVHCAQLRIEDCLFRFTIAPDEPTFGVGVFASTETWGLTLERNRFLHDEAYERQLEDPLRILVGYLQAPVTGAARKLDRKQAIDAAFLRPVVQSVLDDALLRDNLFDGVGVAVLALGKLGAVRLESNTVRHAYAGFVLLEPAWLYAVNVLGEVSVAKPRLKAAREIQDMLLGSVLDDYVATAAALARAYPLPQELAAYDPVEVVPGAKEKEVLVQQLQKMVDTAAPHVAEKQAPAAEARAAGKAPKTMEETLAERALLEGGTRAAGRYFELTNFDAAAQQAAHAQLAERGLHLSLHLADNDVQTYTAGAPLSGPSLVVLDALTDEGEATLVGNRLRNRTEATSPTGVVVFVPIAAVSGNLVVNDALGASLVLLPIERLETSFGSHAAAGTGSETVSVAGNTFIGPPVLPARPHAAPFNTWKLLNAIVG